MLIGVVVAETEQGVAQAILKGMIDFERDPWPLVSESAKSLVKQMLDPDPRRRLTAQQVLGKHPLTLLGDDGTLVNLALCFYLLLRE